MKKKRKTLHQDIMSLVERDDGINTAIHEHAKGYSTKKGFKAKLFKGYRKNDILGV